MLNVLSLSILALVVSSVTGLAIPRAPDSSNWDTSLEEYAGYHARYLTLGCQNKHSDAAYFDKCCHPLPSGSQPDPSCGSPTTTTDSQSDANDDGDCNGSDGSDGDNNNSDGSEGNNNDSYGTHSTSSPEATARVASVDVTAGASTSSSSNSGYVSGGFATFFYQNGNAGACGKYHSDQDLIAAMDIDRYGDTSRKSSLCGKQVQITNTKNGKSVTVTVADACPTCRNSNSIDLSHGAFIEIATESEGEVPIKWKYL